MNSDPNLKSRRDVLQGRLMGDAGAPPEHHVTSLVVHARPDRLPEVLAALRAMAEVEIHAENPSGKIVITLETRTESDVVQRMGTIGELPGVLSTALVFHHFEAATGIDQET